MQCPPSVLTRPPTPGDPVGAGSPPHGSRHVAREAALSESRAAAWSAGGPERRARRRAWGQSLAEIALAMPLFTGLTLGVADGGRAFYYNEAVVNAARQALREAVTDTNGLVQPYAGALACVSIGSTATAVSAAAHVPWQVGDTASLTTIANAAALESSSDGTAAGSRIAGATITVTWHCKSGTSIANAANGGVTDPSNVASDAVEVRISYSFTLLTPLVGRMFGSGSPAIAADVVGRAEY